MPGVIPVADVIRTLNESKVRFVLVGPMAGTLAQGIQSYRGRGRGRGGRQLKKALAALTEAFPILEAVDLPMVVRLRERGTEYVRVDVMKPVQQPYCEAFQAYSRWCSMARNARFPSLEMAIVMKFAAMTSVYRAVEDKYRDAHDFIRMVKNNDVDEEKLTHLARCCTPPAVRMCWT